MKNQDFHFMRTVCKERVFIDTVPFTNQLSFVNRFLLVLTAAKKPVLSYCAYGVRLFIQPTFYRERVTEYYRVMAPRSVSTHVYRYATRFRFLVADES